MIIHNGILRRLGCFIGRFLSVFNLCSYNFCTKSFLELSQRSNEVKFKVTYLGMWVCYVKLTLRTLKIFQALIDSDFGIYFNNHQIQFEQKLFQPTIFLHHIKKNLMDQSGTRIWSRDNLEIECLVSSGNNGPRGQVSCTLVHRAVPNGTSKVCILIQKSSFFNLSWFLGFSFYVRKWTHKATYIYVAQEIFTIQPFFHKKIVILIRNLPILSKLPKISQNFY